MTDLTEVQEYFLYWIKERESVRTKKDQGLPKPWSEDPIFQNYRFCNVQREQDTVSKWLQANWYDRYDGNSNLWFSAVVARLFNWPITLELIGFPALLGEEFYDWKEATRALLKHRRDKEKVKVFTGAYLVSTNGVQMDKIDYILDRVLTPIWERGRAPLKDEKLEDYWTFLRQFDGLGSFMAGQVVADLKYTSNLKNAADWWTWAPLGPGSKRGLNRYYGRPLEQGLSQEKALRELSYARILIQDRLGWNLPVHNVQNCFCEFDKYVRVKLGEGKPRSSYPGVK